jgi:hypothetical protein
MQKVLKVLLAVSWALWMGGMISLLIFVIRLFKASHEIGAASAPVLFHAFADYQIIVGIIACASGTLMTLRTRRTAHALMTLVMLGAFASALLIRGWTFEMESLRAAGRSGGPEFKAMHGRSSIAYTTSAGLLLTSGVGWILTLPANRTERKTDRA